jgi:hypothetical protein
MYQQSRKILVFLVVIYVALLAVTTFTLAIQNSHTSGGEFQLWLKDLSASGSRDVYQWSISSPAPICAVIAIREIPYS